MFNREFQDIFAPISESSMTLVLLGAKVLWHFDSSEMELIVYIWTMCFVHTSRYPAESHQEHSEDHKVNEDGLGSQVC